MKFTERCGVDHQVTDGPLIVQSDKTLLLEVDHPRASACRAAIAPFAELERAPEHVHTYRLTPLGLWNARAAGHDAEQVVDTLLEFSRYSVPHALLVDVAETMARYGRLQLVKDEEHGLVLRSLDAPVLEEILRSKKAAPLLGTRIAPDARPGAPQRARQPQAGAAEAGLAGGGPRRLRRRRGARDRPRRGRLDAAALPGRGRGQLLARRVRGRRAALRGRQDPRRGGRDGQGPRDDADPGDQHRLGAAVARRAAQAHLADRGRDRRVLRGPQGDPPGDDRDVPGRDDEAEGRLPAPGAVRRPRLGPHPLRRGPPAARADLPDDRRPAGPPPPRADGDAGARGRPRGRRVLPHRPQALRRAVEGHRGAGLHRPRRLRRGPGHPARLRAPGLRHRRGRREVPAVLDLAVEVPGGREARRPAQGRADAGHRPVHRPARRPRRRASTPR